MDQKLLGLTVVGVIFCLCGQKNVRSVCYSLSCLVLFGVVENAKTDINRTPDPVQLTSLVLTLTRTPDPIQLTSLVLTLTRTPDPIRLTRLVLTLTGTLDAVRLTSLVLTLTDP